MFSGPEEEFVADMVAQGLARVEPLDRLVQEAIGRGWHEMGRVNSSHAKE